MNQVPYLIRQAISREDYPRALELWNAFACQLREAIGRGELTPEGMGEVRELFEWSTVVLRGARGHLQSQWNKTRGVAAYLPRQTHSGHIRTSL